MLIIGNKNIPYEKIKSINSIEDIKNTSAEFIVYFKYNIDTIKYCFDNNVKCAVLISDITEAIFCNALEVNFIISKNNTKQIQIIADNYMFDSKVLEIILDDNDIEQVALNEIDGCIYKETIEC